MTFPDWRRVLKKNIKTLDQLAQFLDLSSEQKKLFLNRSPFPLNLPLRLAEKIDSKDLNDPILLQFAPLVEEEKSSEGFVLDPLEEKEFLKTDALISKYRSRVLLIPSSACAMHCRYCFRRNFPYERKKESFNNELEWIKNEKSLQEVILSGGDPLSLNDDKLKELILELDQVEHLSKIRFHTRFPIGIPERITDELLELFKSIKKQVVFVIHINHANELDEDILSQLKKVQMTGTPVLSQSVLLKGVNDQEEALENLFKKLSDSGIIPYYLHVLDHVKGSEHFLVSDERGKELIASLRLKLPGYAIPTLVREEAFKKSKTPLTSS